MAVYHRTHQCGGHIVYQPGIDERWYVGYCSKCKEKLIKTRKELDDESERQRTGPMVGKDYMDDGGPPSGFLEVS